MGILFGGWVREEAETELWYIKKYGLETGSLAYQQYLKEKAEHTKWCQENPKVVKWSKSEPKVTEGDKICEWKDDEIVREAYITEITDEGDIMCRLMTTNPMSDPNLGAAFRWEGDYRKIM